MAKRESKGQQVKTFKHYEPQPHGNPIEVIGKVYLRNGDTFVIYMPEHIADMTEALPIYAAQSASQVRYRIYSTKREITSPVADEVMTAYARLLREYTEATNLANATKVIIVTFNKNLPYRDDRPHIFTSSSGTLAGGFGGDISFSQPPAISLQMDILWRNGDKLFRRHEPHYKDEQPRLVSAGSIPVVDRYNKSRAMLDWTQEREDFLRGTINKITELGFLLTDFFGDLETNITYALTQGGGNLALPPPKETTDEPEKSQPVYFDRNGNLRPEPLTVETTHRLAEPQERGVPDAGGQSAGQATAVRDRQRPRSR